VILQTNSNTLFFNENRLLVSPSSYKVFIDNKLSFSLSQFCSVYSITSNSKDMKVFLFILTMCPSMAVGDKYNMQLGLKCKTKGLLSRNELCHKQTWVT